MGGGLLGRFWDALARLLGWVHHHGLVVILGIWGVGWVSSGMHGIGVLGRGMWVGRGVGIWGVRWVVVLGVRRPVDGVRGIHEGIWMVVRLEHRPRRRRVVVVVDEGRRGRWRGVRRRRGAVVVVSGGALVRSPGLPSAFGGSGGRLRSGRQRLRRQRLLGGCRGIWIAGRG